MTELQTLSPPPCRKHFRGSALGRWVRGIAGYNYNSTAARRPYVRLLIKLLRLQLGTTESASRNILLFAEMQLYGLVFTVRQHGTSRRPLVCLSVCLSVTLSLLYLNSK